MLRIKQQTVDWFVSKLSQLCRPRASPTTAHILVLLYHYCYYYYYTVLLCVEYQYCYYYYDYYIHRVKPVFLL